MQTFSISDYQMIEQLVKKNQVQLRQSLYKTLKRLGYSPTITKDYVYAPGPLPVMLLAHTDTVFKKLPTEIYYDEKKNVMWSPQGLGADDRAGVFAILKILQSGYRPSILFTADEEVGGLGARAFCRDYVKPTTDVKYCVQLDRQGIVDCVFYDCDNKEFNNYVESFGFITDWGTFTDISHICPHWKIAGVNLSVGYVDEHSQVERLHVGALYHTIDKVKKMLDDADNAKFFEYIPDKYMSRYFGGVKGFTSYWYDYDYDNDDESDLSTRFSTSSTCSCCKQTFLHEELFAAKKRISKNSKNNEYVLFCPECIVNNVRWCDNCGAGYVYDGENDSGLCRDCLEGVNMVSSRQDVRVAYGSSE